MLFIIILIYISGSHTRVGARVEEAKFIIACQPAAVNTRHSCPESDVNSPKQTMGLTPWGLCAMCACACFLLLAGVGGVMNVTGFGLARGACVVHTRVTPESESTGVAGSGCGRGDKNCGLLARLLAVLIRAVWADLGFGFGLTSEEGICASQH